MNSQDNLDATKNLNGPPIAAFAGWLLRHIRTHSSWQRDEPLKQLHHALEAWQQLPEAEQQRILQRR